MRAAVISIDKLIEQVREEVIRRSALMLSKRMNGEAIEADELKELAKIKTELKFITKTYEEMNGGKIEKKDDFSPEMLQKIKNLQSTVGEIMRSMPKK